MVVDASFASAEVVRCSAPPRRDPGEFPVHVSIDGGRSFGGPKLFHAGHFRYMAPSFASSLVPRAGPDTGGTAVTVIGGEFNRATPYTCSFGSLPGSSLGVVHAAFVSSSQLVCISPPASDPSQLGREISVQVSMDLGEGFIAMAAGPEGVGTTFTYMASVELAEIHPNHGTVAGGTVVEISGANFRPVEPTRSTSARSQNESVGTTDAVWCRFGSIVTVGSRVSDSLLRCASPPKGPWEAVDVEVSVSINGGADFAGGAPGAELVR